MQGGSDSDQRSDSDSSSDDSRKRIDLILDRKVERGQVCCGTDLYSLSLWVLHVLVDGPFLLVCLFVYRQTFYFCKFKGESYQNAEWITAADLCSQYDVIFFARLM